MLLVGAIDGTHICIKATIPENRHDFYWPKHRYFINTPAAMGQNLQLNNVATSFPGSIHDSKVHYIIDQTTMKYC